MAERAGAEITVAEGASHVPMMSQPQRVADNLFMLRYDQEGRSLAPTITIVKTRGSEHDRRTHTITVAQGGMRVGPLAPPAGAGRSVVHPNCQQ